MKFIAILSRALMKPGEKPVELKKLSFEAPSLTAAKSRVSKEANTLNSGRLLATSTASSTTTAT